MKLKRILKYSCLVLIVLLILNVLPSFFYDPETNPHPLPRFYKKGVYHMHSKFSDGKGTIHEITKAAAALNLDFVILTDHGRPNIQSSNSTSWLNQVLLIGGTELSLNCGHLATMDFKVPDYIFPPEPQEAIDEIIKDNENGVCFISHPFDDKVPWTDWDISGFTGLEILSSYTEARRAGILKAFIFPLKYKIDSRYALLDTMRYPSPEVKKWDTLNESGRYYGIFALDAHAKLPITRKIQLNFPSYRSMFEIMTVYVKLDKRFLQWPVEVPHGMGDRRRSFGPSLGALIGAPGLPVISSDTSKDNRLMAAHNTPDFFHHSSFIIHHSTLRPLVAEGIKSTVLAADEAASAIISSLKAGNFFNVIEGIASANGFEAFFIEVGGHRLEMGSIIKAKKGKLVILLPFDFETRVLVLKNGIKSEQIANKQKNPLEIDINGPGVYRVEVYVPGNTFNDLPWIMTNPFFVGVLPTLPSPLPNPESIPGEPIPGAPDKFKVEKNRHSQGTIAYEFIGENEEKERMVRFTFKLKKDSPGEKDFWSVMALRQGYDFSGYRGFGFEARSDKNRRFWVEFRTGKGDTEVWYRHSFLVDQGWRRVVIPFCKFHAFHGERRVPDLSTVTAVFFGINNAIAYPGTAGEICLKNVSVY